jgi:anti-sigma factor RsiW
MCDLQPKLIAWLDHELPPDQAAELESHLQACVQCQTERDRYERVSTTFHAYCNAVLTSKTHRTVPRWVAPVSGALLAITATVLLVTLQRPAIAPPSPVLTPAATRIPAAPVNPVASESTSESALPKPLHTRRARPPLPAPSAKWQPAETAVQIAIPAETMFAPGAIPEGMNFIAELSIGPDGSVERLRLRP